MGFWIEFSFINIITTFKLQNERIKNIRKYLSI